MDEKILVIAVTLAALVGSPLIQGIKAVYAELFGKPLEDKAAMITTIIVSFILAGVALSIAGAFSPPYPTEWQGWATLIGGSIGAVFSVMTVIFKALIKPVIEQKEYREYEDKTRYLS